MREYKFRGLGSGHFRYGYLVINEKDGAFIFSPYKGEYLQYPVDIETVGQHTGMKDSTGKEIFEGDVIRISRPFVEYKIGRVFWYENNYAFKVRWDKQDYWYDWLL